MEKIRHVLGISGGKDSSALAIYLKDKYPELNIEYYFCDTGKELKETYELIDKLQKYLGKEILPLKAAENSPKNSFDHFITMYGGYLPSSNARWCTQKLKLEPFEKFVGNSPVISYVGIRGDEDREGYISTKSNIQSIFPFRKNIWSEDVVSKVLNNNQIENIIDICKKIQNIDKGILTVIKKPLSSSFNQTYKLNSLLNFGVKFFNEIVFEFLKSTDYPLSRESSFPLIDNEDVLIKDDIFRILKESNVGIPSYYNKVEFEVNGQKGFYNRSRSGCFFCFFQQKIEWIWLYENHKDLYLKAMEYEKDGYTWIQNESLSELIKPERIEKIKLDQLKKTEKQTFVKSEYLLDILEDEDERGCAACFI